MRKFLIVLTALTLSLPAFSQIPLLDRVEGQRVRFHYSYSLSRNASPMETVTDGDVTVEGNAYVMEGLGLRVVSDGQTRWTLDPEARELVIEKVEHEDLFTNPALFIRSYKQYMDRIQVNGQGSDSLDVTLSLDEDTKARFVLSGILFGPEEGKSDFSFDEKSLSEGYVITDLR